jgi:hypothetical protein
MPTSTTYIHWSPRYGPGRGGGAGRTAQPYDTLCLNTLFESPADLDVEYRHYCDRNGAPVMHEDTSVMRCMQIQVRVLSLAGLMARRYDSQGTASADRFAGNMQLTAQHNTHNMDMDQTIRVLSSLDLRRGSGSFSDFIKQPSTNRLPSRTLTDFLPRYGDTWDIFLTADKRNIKLPVNRAL